MPEAFFFGPNERQLFAIYHPSTSVDSRLLTVICPPLFTEFNRTHSILRRLAVSLAQRGQHVLRMDYSGTGDSFGNLEELSIPDWVQDIALTVQEGRELTGCNKVQLLGVRASAMLACKSVDATNDIERLVLWDPVSDGAEYLKSLIRKQKSILEDNHLISRAERREAMRKYAEHGLSECMLEGLRSLDANAYSNVPKSKLSVVSTSTSNEFPVQDVSEVVVPFACHWEMAEESLIISQTVLENLMSCLTKP